MISGEKMNKRISKQHGFTLQELGIAIAVIAIISAVAFPSYAGYLTKTRRAEAINFLLNERQTQIHHHLDDRTYKATLSTVNAIAGTNPYEFEIQPGSTGSYATSFIISATPLEKGDEKCGVLTINQDGLQKSTKGGPECWK